MDRNISPPPPKRRKLSPTTDPISPHNSTPLDAAFSNTQDKDAIRIFSWNINGITPFLQTRLTNYFTKRKRSPNSDAEENTPQASLRAFLRRHNWPHVLCLQEVKISATDVKTQSAVRRAVNAKTGNDDNGAEYDVFFTLPNDKFNARGLGGKGKVYGVCSIVRSDIMKQYNIKVRDVPWDTEGRVSIIEIYGHHDTTPSQSSTTNPQDKLAILNIYAVNGTTNPYCDPKTGTLVGTRHNRKLSFHAHLMSESLHLQSLGFSIILIGDLNIAPARIDGHPNLRTFPEQHVINRADFRRRFLDGKGEDRMFHGVDVWREFRGVERKFTYFPRGVTWGSSCDRVDLCLVDRAFVEKGGLVGCEIWDSEMERGPSDHVPISVDVRVV
ncbi:DNase I-like protein [Tothia fuscella]|uniref:DNase I-like protein n=1 Tax=Tothia fuscella TaxID=1048955 RepID=A0A9P4NSH5_9PEZI|nr:DNase I-like protein [Tothia fuscella]